MRILVLEKLESIRREQNNFQNKKWGGFLGESLITFKPETLNDEELLWHYVKVYNWNERYS